MYECHPLSKFVLGIDWIALLVLLKLMGIIPLNPRSPGPEFKNIQISIILEQCRERKQLCTRGDCAALGT